MAGMITTSATTMLMIAVESDRRLTTFSTSISAGCAMKASSIPHASGVRNGSISSYSS